MSCIFSSTDRVSSTETARCPSVTPVWWSTPPPMETTLSGATGNRSVISDHYRNHCIYHSQSIKDIKNSSCLQCTIVIAHQAHWLLYMYMQMIWYQIIHGFMSMNVCKTCCDKKFNPWNSPMATTNHICQIYHMWTKDNLLNYFPLLWGSFCFWMTKYLIANLWNTCPTLPTDITSGWQG